MYNVQCTNYVAEQHKSAKGVTYFAGALYINYNITPGHIGLPPPEKY